VLGHENNGGDPGRRNTGGSGITGETEKKESKGIDGKKKERNRNIQNRI